MATIGYDAKRLFYNSTGLGNYSRGLVSSMAEYFPQHQYYLYSPNGSKLPQAAPFLQKNDFRIRQAPALRLPGLGSWWRSFGIRRALKADRIELYHGLSHELPFGIDNTGIKTVVTVHDLIHKIYPVQYPYAQRQMYDLKCRHACRQADAIVAVSTCSKEDIIQHYGVSPEKISVIYPSCEPAFLQSAETLPNIQGLDLPAHFLLYVGAIVERKNLLELVKALHRLPKSLQLPLVVVGKGKGYERQVRQYLESQRLAQLVMFRPDVSTKQLAGIYRSAKMLIYPSSYEGFGIPVLEALSSGTPVITSKVSALSEAGGNCVHYANPKSPEDLCRAIELLLTDEAYKEQLAKGREAHLKQFNRRQLAGQLHHVYQNLL